MERSIFSADRNIYLKDCLIKADQPPMSVFMKAKYPYDAVTFTGHVKYEKFKNILRFASHLGESIKEVNFHHFLIPKHDKALSVFLAMPLVKKFTFEYCDIKKALPVVKLQSQNPNFFHLIKILKIWGGVYDLNGHFDDLMPFISKGFTISIDSLAVASQVGLDQFLPIVQYLQINQLEFYVKGITYKNMMKLLDVEKIFCQQMELRHVDGNPYSFLELFLKKHQNIRDVALYYSHLPPPISFPQITELCLTLKEPVNSLKPLEFLENLQIFTIDSHDVVDATCDFGHEPITLNKLEKFETRGLRWTCQDCCEALSSSFVNLKEFNGWIEVSEDAKIFQMMLKNWKYLASMTFKCEILELQEHNFEGFDSQRQYLTELYITSDKGNFTTDAMAKLSRIFPNFERIEIETEHGLAKPSLEEIVQKIVPLCGKLKWLCIECRLEQDCFCNIHSMSGTEVNKIVKHLEEHEFSVKVSRILLSNMISMTYLLSSVFRLKHQIFLIMNGVAFILSI